MAMTYWFQHPNLVSVMGYCDEPPVFVSPYMPRRSLYRNLHHWKVQIYMWDSVILVQIDSGYFTSRLNMHWHGNQVVFVKVINTQVTPNFFFYLFPLYSSTKKDCFMPPGFCETMTYSSSG